ncbi:hypothetical protein [Ochrobactrum sp. SFR4]|uniref:hypothetical protein n=1 Tax=Ochrobactrum sp. SFR4 TaxID=2717368 RepID=UPI001C8BC3A3|nr:hypothetical protein [Ochrobactrum sp. SFR4]MBX8825240.1 hypothetical protein [Ochrobactrum sp. SFR4]
MTTIFDLESPACNAHSMASILLDRLHRHFERSHQGLTGSKDYYYLSAEDIDCLLFAAGQLKAMVGTVKTTVYSVLDEQNADTQPLPKAA